MVFAVEHAGAGAPVFQVDALPGLPVAFQV